MIMPSFLLASDNSAGCFEVAKEDVWHITFVQESACRNDIILNIDGYSD
jgi:hypothetical protein